MRKRNTLVKGVGINDADYEVVSHDESGKRVQCLFYSRWSNMLMRCYSTLYKANRPTYDGTSVSDEWLTFMNFKTWMEAQDWEGNHLDKDILYADNKVYSAETCAFVSLETNMFLTDRSNTRGDCPLGVTISKNRDRYISRINVNSKLTYLGTYDTPEGAHQAWYSRKRELAIELAAKQTDPRVAAALIARFP